jgi:hypothetical protein
MQASLISELANVSVTVSRSSQNRIDPPLGQITTTNKTNLVATDWMRGAQVQLPASL